MLLQQCEFWIWVIQVSLILFGNSHISSRGTPLEESKISTDKLLTVMSLWTCNLAYGLP